MCLCYYLFFLGCKNNIYLLIVAVFFEKKNLMWGLKKIVFLPQNF